MVDKERILLKVIQKIPMFQGLGSDPSHLVLQLCVFRGVASGECVCQVNGQSDEM
ncbi:MAG: hypothetical protein OSB73_09940 [Candidatus Latescibacteria bacterium]|nr:hypothetical protein [Candidatus Latescibacterota bacterium]